MFGIGSTELVIILVFGFLLFGPDKLPQMGRTIGRAMRQFRETQEKLTAVVQTEVVDPMAAAAKQPAKAASASVAAPADDSDADVPAAQEAPARKETFAERRARLAAERAEAEAAKAAAAEGADSASEEVVPSAEPASEPATASDAPASAPESETVPAEPAVMTTEDLYARRPRKRKPAAETGQDLAIPESPVKGGEQ